MSQLLGIIQRLNAMQEDDSAETQARRFEKEGTPVCEVKYCRDSKEYEIKIYEPNSSYKFDDIDLVAMEVYDILKEN